MGESSHLWCKYHDKINSKLGPFVKQRTSGAVIGSRRIFVVASTTKAKKLASSLPSLCISFAILPSSLRKWVRLELYFCWFLMLVSGANVNGTNHKTRHLWWFLLFHPRKKKATLRWLWIFYISDNLQDYFFGSVFFSPTGFTTLSTKLPFLSKCSIFFSFPLQINTTL